MSYLWLVAIPTIVILYEFAPADASKAAEQTQITIEKDTVSITSK